MLLEAMGGGGIVRYLHSKPAQSACARQWGSKRCCRSLYLIEAEVEAERIAKSMCLARSGHPASLAACPAHHRYRTLSASFAMESVIFFQR